MTLPNLRDLLDEATSDIPASVAQPPLSAIRGRISRRRAMLAASGAAALALVLAVAIPLQVSKAGPAPAATPPGVSWEFGFIDGSKLTVWATKLRKCTYLDNPVATAERAGESYVIRLTGELDTVSGCMTPDANGVTYRVELAQATVQFDEAIPKHLIKDAVTGQTRPIYDRSELPTNFIHGGAHSYSRGAVSTNGDPAEFRGHFQSQRETSPSSGFDKVEFRGLGLSTTRPAIAEGEAATFGSVNGVLAPTADGRSYRFVWHMPRGNSWITYEMFTFEYRTKAELVSLLQRLAWP